LCHVPYKYFAQGSFILPVFPFFGVGELDVHVTVHGIQSAVVFHAPFEFYDDVFSRQVLKEGFWIDLSTLATCRLEREREKRKRKHTGINWAMLFVYSLFGFWLVAKTKRSSSSIVLQMPKRQNKGRDYRPCDAGRPTIISQ